jgi:hypothetical protein
MYKLFAYLSKMTENLQQRSLVYCQVAPGQKYPPMRLFLLFTRPAYLTKS